MCSNANSHSASSPPTAASQASASTPGAAAPAANAPPSAAARRSDPSGPKNPPAVSATPRNMPGSTPKGLSMTAAPASSPAHPAAAAPPRPSSTRAASTNDPARNGHIWKSRSDAMSGPPPTWWRTNNTAAAAAPNQPNGRQNTNASHTVTARNTRSEIRSERSSGPRSVCVARGMRNAPGGLGSRKSR